MTVCGPRTQHDRHQAVFLRPLFSQFHYTVLFRLFHSQDISQIKVIHNLSTEHLVDKNEPCLNRHRLEPEEPGRHFLNGSLAVLEGECRRGVYHLRRPFP